MIGIHYTWERWAIIDVDVDFDEETKDELRMRDPIGNEPNLHDKI